MFEECFGEGPFIFRLNETGTGPQLLTQVCLERGWREYNSENGDNWNLWWRTSGFPVSHHRSLYAWQYINHIPKGSAICRKDNLVRYLRCMKKVYGSIYDFSPHGFNLPLEYTKLAAECSSLAQNSKDEEKHGYFDDKPVWICKPVAQSQGRGIFLFRKLSELTYDTNTIVQKYIEKPLLIGGYKFDLRLYVCIPSYHPMTIYMYREGLARFGTDKFTLNDLRNPFRHLTNSSINKLGPGYAEMKDRVGSGCKWTFWQLRRYFQQAKIADWLLWQRITALVILTVLCHVSQVPPTINCFEFFGFDVLIDNTLRPWLLEVNLSPALGNDCDADRSVKKPMLHDMFDLLGLPLFNTGLALYHIWNDDSKENENEEEEEQQVEGDFLCSKPVLNAAGRWRRKHRKMSALSNSRSSSGTRPNSSVVRPHSSVRPKTRAPSTKTQSHQHHTKGHHHKSRNMVSPKLSTRNKEKINVAEPILGRNLENDQKKNGSSKRWGNGKDWTNPPPSEGGWIRLWPMSLEPNNNNETTIKGGVKHIVSEVTRFSKLAKEIMKNNPTASECQLNEFLQEAMGMTREVWIPPV